ncbi:hypothetical protein FPSE5266_20068 [Fusarium pseudograminearum]|nr:hypothetical protein FPSE5266_20068 [Fusarium pseudograminearum]
MHSTQDPGAAIVEIGDPQASSCHKPPLQQDITQAHSSAPFDIAASGVGLRASQCICGYPTSGAASLSPHPRLGTDSIWGGHGSVLVSFGLRLAAMDINMVGHWLMGAALPRGELGSLFPTPTLRAVVQSGPAVMRRVAPAVFGASVPGTPVSPDYLFPQTLLKPWRLDCLTALAPHVSLDMYLTAPTALQNPFQW